MVTALTLPPIHELSIAASAEQPLVDFDQPAVWCIARRDDLTKSLCGSSVIPGTVPSNELIEPVICPECQKIENMALGVRP